MHTLLDYDSLLPEFVNITDGKCGDNRGDIPVSPHSVVVADRGYCDLLLSDKDKKVCQSSRILLSKVHFMLLWCIYLLLGISPRSC